MSQRKITFSIGIPAYKATYLEECISSILAQTETSFELIIINDCSPEPLKQVVERFSDPRIYYFENDKNCGAIDVVDNWNKCLQKASGEFFVLMGDDDTLEPDYLQEFVRLIAVYPDLDVYHCRTAIINEESRRISLTPSWPEYETVYDNIWHRLELHRIQFISDFIYRRATLVANGGFYKLPLAWASDDLTAYIASANKGIAHTNRAVFNYRKNRINISTTGNAEYKMKAIIAEQSWFDDFLRNIPESESDKLIRVNILNRLPEYIQHRKRRTLTDSHAKGILASVSFWVSKRKQYALTMKDIVVSVVKFIFIKPNKR